jgi:hypothetical protein
MKNTKQSHTPVQIANITDNTPRYPFFCAIKLSARVALMPTSQSALARARPLEDGTFAYCARNLEDEAKC